LHELVRSHITQVLGAAPVRVQPLSGGMIGEVYRIELADGRTIVAKVGDTAQANLSLEGYMLRYLAEHSRLPVPQVLHSEDTLLLMTFIEGESYLGPTEQRHAAVRSGTRYAHRASASAKPTHKFVDRLLPRTALDVHGSFGAQ
jgi:hypothetical protein